MRVLPCLILCILSILLTPTFAILESYVVYMGAHSHDHDITNFDLLQVQESHYDFLGSFIGRDKAKEAIFYSYTRHINGFAAVLDVDQAAIIAGHPKVVSMFLNQGRKLHTTRSWTFLGVEKVNGEVPPPSIWNHARFGEHTIIANFDTGVWPESKSFSDEGMKPIPSRWKGICQNDTDFGGIRCNRKLIGARYFNKGYLSALSTANSTTPTTVSFTPRDTNGHGTHTLSTAAGSFVPNASVFGYGWGTAKGGSPRARVAAYKVCWPPVSGNECFDADLVAAFDAAIADGVDVISASLGGQPTPYFNNSLSIGAFHAVMKGIVVVCSAGNAGPSEGTVSNLSPWEITVGASTMDREFANAVVLGSRKKIRGESLATKLLLPGKFYPLMSAVDAKANKASVEDAQLCEPGSLDPEKAKGKILVCLRGDNARVDKGEQVALAGGVGMVLSNNQATGNELIADPHVLPASHISYADGVAIFSYINSTEFPKAYITRPLTQLGTKPSPFMAAFSSKGPNAITPEILKPDVTAPGVSVIAAYTEAQGPTNLVFDKRRVQFNSISGTSMSCPHVSGVAGLLKTLYPHWSPAAIKSAIMTTAVVIDNVREPIENASNKRANPFSYGAGHIQPNRAMDPGLVYDLTVNDYLNFLCALGYNESTIALFYANSYRCPKNFSIVNLNYPSITVPNLKNSITVIRTLKNVGKPASYTAKVQKPAGIFVSIDPRVLKFERVNEEKSFRINLRVKSAKAAAKGFVFGRLTWSDGQNYVSSPLTVKAV